MGSDDATTCHILFLRTAHATSVVHLDGGPDATETFVKRSITSFRRVSKPSTNASEPLHVEVYLVGGFDDSRGISRHVLSDLLSVLHDTPDALFSVRLFAAGPRNSSAQRPAFLTKTHPMDSSDSSERPQYPVAYGATIDLSTGRVRRARFALNARAPDAALRLAAINCDPALRVVYDELSGSNESQPPLLTVAPFECTLPADYIRGHILAPAERSPTRFLSVNSTSPHAEPDHFIELMLDSYRLLVPASADDADDSKEPDARVTRKFFSGLDPKAPSTTPIARLYQLSPDGHWLRVQ